MHENISTHWAVERTCERCGASFVAAANQIKKGWGRFCSRACKDLAGRVSIEQRFWTKVAVTDDPDACWLWTAATFPNGYGQIEVNRRATGAHVIAWEMANGPIPEGLHVCHTCDVKRCVRNDGERSHLFLGTHADNMADRDSKGRQASGDRSGPHLYPERLPHGDDHWTRKHPERTFKGDRNPNRINPPRGERNPRARLTWDQVREIRQRYEAGRYHGILVDLGNEFGVDPVTISYIVNGKTWRE